MVILSVLCRRRRVGETLGPARIDIHGELSRGVNPPHRLSKGPGETVSYEG